MNWSVVLRGRKWKLAEKRPRETSTRVYNFEVEHEHVYYVSEQGILVHNLYTVYVIKNAKTGVIKYAGITSGKLSVRAAKHAARMKVNKTGKKSC